MPDYGHILQRAVIALTVLLTPWALAQQKREVQKMSQSGSQQQVLSQQILALDIPGARATAESLGARSGPVLESLAKNQKTKVRLLVLELAPLALSAESSRAVLGLVQDENATVRAVAMGELTICQQKDVVVDMVKLLKKKPETDLKVSLIRQIGLAGDSNNIADIRPFLSESDADVAHQASITLARLGDAQQKGKILAELAAVDPAVRLQGLRDCQYVADQSLAAHFGPLLDDRRDVMVITPPHVEPLVRARVCDVTVQTMAYMRFHFSFAAEFLARRTDAELEEAKAIVASLNATQMQH